MKSTEVYFFMLAHLSSHEEHEKLASLHIEGKKLVRRSKMEKKKRKEKRKKERSSNPKRRQWLIVHAC